MVCNVLHLVQKPVVYLGQLIEPLNSVAGMQGSCQNKDALVCGCLQLLGYEKIIFRFSFSCRFLISLLQKNLASDMGVRW